MLKIEKHSDCSFYLPIDVAKGLCLRTNSNLDLDSAVCKKGVLKEKCKYCKHYYESDKNQTDNGKIGICKGLSKEDWVYGELSAENCTSWQLNEGK